VFRKISPLNFPRLVDLLIKTRNASVTDALEKAYVSNTNGGKLDVFCVDNIAYREAASLNESVNSSGIPDLRRFCSVVSAEARFHEAQNFYKSYLPDLLNSIQLSVARSQRNPAKLREEARHQLTEELMESRIKVFGNLLSSVVRNSQN
jgi:hypothetical protein